MLLSDRHIIDIYRIREPSVSFLELDVVAAHLSLPHAAVLSERPVLKAVASLPLETIT